MTNGSAPNARRRVAALAAIALLVLALISVALGTLSNLGALLVGLVAIFGVVVGGWYVVSRRGGVRLIAFGVLVASLVLLVSTLFIGDPEWAGIVTGAVLGAMSVGAARYALHGTKQERTQPLANEEAAPPARRPVLLMNPKSGGGKAEKFKLVEECEKRGIEAIVLQQGDDLLELAEDAVARGADVIGMAGGDGSQALVSSVASAHDIPHVVIPAGTRNHFALDLGLDRNDVVGALDAYADGVERRIDLADVNGRVFVNNASLGLYAKIVQSEEYRDAKRQTAADMLPSMLGPDAAPLDLHYTGPDGAEVPSAHLIQVSNDPYELRHLVGAGTRARLDLGVLGVVAVKVGSPAQGWEVASFEVRSGAPIEIGVDGEALTMEPPLVFTSRPGALRVRLPRHAPGASPAAKAVYMSRSTIGELARIVAGRPA